MRSPRRPDRVRTATLRPGRPAPAEMVGAVLVRDLVVDGQRWPKGRQLVAEDLALLAVEGAVAPGIKALTVIIPGPDELHQNEAATRLAADVPGPGRKTRGPNGGAV